METKIVLLEVVWIFFFRIQILLMVSTVHELVVGEKNPLITEVHVILHTSKHISLYHINCIHYCIHCKYL